MSENLKQNKPKNKPDLSQRKRTLTRLMAIQTFYQFDFFQQKEALDEIKNTLIDNYALTPDEEIKSYRAKIDYDLLTNLLNGLTLGLSEIDADVSEFLKNEWTIDKLQNILLQILRFGAFELKFSKDIPLKVLINEYVDITAMFFESPQVTFTNSVLENLAKKYREEEFLQLRK